jgi:LCP family protein required for cell wall assembly
MKKVHEFIESSNTKNDTLLKSASSSVTLPVEDQVDQNTANNKIPKKKKGFSIGKIISLVLIFASLIALVGGGVFLTQAFSTADKVVVQDGECSGIFNISCLNLPNPLASNTRQPVKGEAEGRTNFLIIGTDKAGSLTDTIILISYFHKEKKVVTVNFPRDLYISTTYKNASGANVRIAEKINALYPFAQRANPDNEGAGAEALSSLISAEYSIPVHYWATTNFEAVEQVVNELGGVTVEVDKAFTDCQYPTRRYGYLRPCPSFKVGPEKMNGERALIYARSRMAAGDGGDFARSRRQSLVIEAVAKEAKAKGIFGNIRNINSYLGILSQNVRTNIQPTEMLSFYQLTEDVDIEGSFLRVIWQNDNGFLCDGPASAGRGYHILYCGGKIIGSNGDSPAKTRAKNQIQNLLFEAQSAELYEAKVAVLGNRSGETTSFRNSLQSTGFKNIVFNNVYTGVTAATRASQEKTTVYIPDEKLRDLFSKAGLSKEYTLEAALPADKILPDNAKDASIVVLVESI